MSQADGYHLFARLRPNRKLDVDGAAQPAQGHRAEGGFFGLVPDQAQQGFFAVEQFVLLQFGHGKLAGQRVRLVAGEHLARRRDAVGNLVFRREGSVLALDGDDERHGSLQSNLRKCSGISVCISLGK
ncbi:hypothetical protein MCA0265 [Methylococcus capsulatus str. Bath]|uniref:Uncharacterized protein n=1 Tax=Methylococcus capsulatus (strain ATCC 33009 / NCIMB 11132 / Bath) TaxID=243233 RepID=Q60C46_METCA|nr:hypothetical protein MCA0265 [Methylococcus capsulatus str. Bath]